MKLEIRDFSSADIDDVWNWNPSSHEDVFFQLEFEIGEVGQLGGNLFQLVIATPEGIRKFSKEFGTNRVPNRNLLVIGDFDWKSLVRKLEEIIQSCERATWNESIICLQRFFQWEYEDCRFEGDDN